ncbi:MAG: hypothetical protein DSY43_04680 [Gammaproteobacteria bacterium]|uniref:Uncharacterized protein n=1 Tax=endosymbiont of Bathymodiolus septemdierum str. Myojin knoll TaxID=1303921 RepID=A0A0P0UTI3_9GAMM|nr:hypothetical protein [Bathymodiolus septemdierum thioautotrophic gill symbiont]RUA05394.1 MAG: hypothetical protein DSY43_04680 [Gammaproteobacteria bacterium]BAS68369.1 hypothetical protein BSEPE_1388 [endosymbiont of Bathymodiolus septemdierum str. Myojin knoll]
MVWYKNSITEDNKAELHKLACQGERKSNSPWHIINLYNCEENTLFIPYQLWSGADWNGDKNSACMHKANTSFYVNENSGTTIKGPKKWLNPKTNQEIEVWFREKMNGSKQQFFTCNEKGIGRVYDSRRGGRYYKLGRCKFPAGFGWSIGVQRKCKSTMIEIIKIDLNSDNDLSAIEFKWWYKNKKGKHIHDHTYRYEAGYGSTNAWKQ